MQEIFLKILNMSITAGWVVLAVIVLRLIFRKAPKYIHCALWVLVAVRLVCPFSFESMFSLLPSGETLPAEVLSGSGFDVNTGIAPIDLQINDYLEDRYDEGVTVPADTGVHVVMIIAVIWLAGMALMAAYSIYSYSKLKRSVAAAIPLKDQIWICDEIDTPFIAGVVRPRIYLPSDMEKDSIPYVIAHEKAHLQRHDNLWKPIGYLLLTIYWFHPLLWLAYILLCRDIEMACDERVIREMDVHDKKEYSRALLACSTSRRILAASPLAFGEGDVRKRIKGVLSYKQPAFWLVIAAVIVCGVAAVCLLTNPKESEIISEQDNMEFLQEKLQEEEQVAIVEGMTEGSASQEMELAEIKAPSISAETISGADGPVLDYASEERLIFHDYYGLFVYDLNQGMTAAIDLSALGCQDTQGDNACEVMIKNDGSTVYMHLVNEDWMYVYDIAEQNLFKDAYDEERIDRFFKLKDIRDCVDPDYTVLRSSLCVPLKNYRYHYLQSGSGMVIDLAWVVEKDGEQVQYIYLFEDDR